MSFCHSDDSLRRLGDDDDLEPADSYEIERHIEACPRCQAQLKAIVEQTSTTGRFMADWLANYDGKLPEVSGFEIERELGCGNWGGVYLARKAGQNRLIALKLMPQSAFPSDGPDDRRRWIREAQAVSSVRHPNVVTLYDYGEEGRWFFLAFEYVPGGSLKDRLTEPLPARTAAELLETSARAVAHIHAEGFLHLDLKPGNILLDGQPDAPWEDVVPKISDFGLSLSHEDLATPETSLDGPRGTPSYMAPEQTAPHRGKIGPGADVYALGAVLYELLTGRPPFRGATHHETMEMVRHADPVHPRRLNPRIPRDLETIALKCLEKTPSRRYATAAAVADDLRRWLDRRPIQARPASLAERTARLCRRNPVVAALCLTLVLTVAAAFGGIIHTLRRERAARQAAELNLEAASIVMGQLGGILLQRYYGHPGRPGDELKQIGALIREQIAKVDSIGSRHPELLNMMSEIDGQIAASLKKGGGRAEARALVVERLELARRAHQAAPTDIRFLIENINALFQAGEFAIDDQHPIEALAGRDQAAALLLGHPGILPDLRTFHPYWTTFALRLSDAYLQLPTVAGRDEHRIAWDRALNERVETAIRTGAVDAKRSDVVLFRACLLADRGDWTALRRLVPSLAALRLDESNDSYWNRVARELGLQSWMDRELRHYVAACELLTDDPELVMKESEQLAKLLGLPKVNEYTKHSIFDAINRGLSIFASRQRATARLDRADRSAQFFRALADRLLREFPTDPSAYRLMSEAHLQESKNAWKRDDLAGVRKSLAASISSLRRALELDPSDDIVRSMLIDKTKRLAALPGS
ncbi:serine/threonine-protein kinase [Paludisphaera borealis]|uniref:Serine/threonine-protein kinase PrkC n=1 Tax=Paludisphaera borealis TaxID=1387353 RepID=A0A1U7CL88_9BACT|nr:serine/threonine-protein kinase [Paludisphaera borealis]APW59677.1 Serine/threonine-protein kinase PrkC [Paludisphaera borealis]